MSRGGLPSASGAAAIDRPRALVRPTGAGAKAFLTCVVIALAAVNTANNLLYLLLGLIMAAGIVSAWWSRRVLLHVRAQVDAPAEIRRGQEAGIVATVSTLARRAPGIVLDLAASDAAGRLAPVVRTFGAIAGDRPVTASLPVTPRRRGRAALELFARSPFPFGLFESHARVGRAEILVLPESDPSWRRALEPSRADGDPAPRKGEGTDIFNIREYSWGEDARRMDWKATARLGRPMLREHAREEQRHAVLVLPSLSPVDAEAAERAISRAAGAAEDLAREGWSLRLLAPAAPGGGGAVDVRGDARAILRALAILELAPPPAAQGWWRERVSPAETVLVLGGLTSAAEPS